MKREEILIRLCWYDQRNPNFYEYYVGYDPAEPRESGCACDNCFYGRDQLAMALIAALDKLEKMGVAL